jgi:hypothetical protein
VHCFFRLLHLTVSTGAQDPVTSQNARSVRSGAIWLAQPAALVENSKLIEAPPHGASLAEVVAEARNFDLVLPCTSTAELSPISPAFGAGLPILSAAIARTSEANDGVDENGVQMAPLPYPGLSQAEIFDSFGTFFRNFHLRPGKIAPIAGEMVLSPEMMKQRLREGAEFFRFARERRATAQ